MNQSKKSPTKVLFESLTKLYKQGQLLLMDSDKFMGEQGWVPRHSNAIAELSYSMNAPQRWFARWAMRFYTPATTEEQEQLVDRMLFVSIHFASDVGSSMESSVDDPLVCAGRLIFEKPMTDKEAGQTYDYWMCKYWFIGKRHDTLEGWRKTGRSQWYENLKGSETFAVPLYDITSSEKLKELIIKALQLGASLLIFDQELNAAQARSISEITEIKVLDRTQLILHIFAEHAHTPDGKIQVELAQLKYILPRLKDKSTAFSRLMGGIGGRGPGEQKLETDRRHIRARISYLEKKLGNISKSRRQRRSKRKHASLPIISIVGYTNAGKSTLLNALTHSHILVENKYFATLDTSSRRLRFPREREAIITDTVGFIRSLPEDLLGAFRSTLEELDDADLLLHVVDVANPCFPEHIEAVKKILYDLELNHIPILQVFNKIDQISQEMVSIYKKRYQGVFICARFLDSLKPLIIQLEGMLEEYGCFYPRAGRSSYCRSHI